MSLPMYVAGAALAGASEAALMQLPIFSSSPWFVVLEPALMYVLGTRGPTGNERLKDLSKGGFVFATGYLLEYYVMRILSGQEHILKAAARASIVPTIGNPASVKPYREGLMI